MARDAFALYTTEGVRNQWIAQLSDYRDGGNNVTTPSGRAGYWGAIVKFLEWIDNATGGGIPALGGRVLTPEEATIITKTINAWKAVRHRAFKDGKRQGVELNKAERVLSAGWWTDMFKMYAIMEDTAQPALRDLMAKGGQKDLTFAEQTLFFHLLMYCLIVTRPCRPSTYAAGYVLVLPSPSAHTSGEGSIACPNLHPHSSSSLNSL